MKPRPKEQGDELDLDALMDAMTNVVAVLILVLLLTQLNVQETIRDVVSRSTVTEADLNSAKKELDALLEKKQSVDSRLNEFNLASEKERLARMQETLAARKKLLETQNKQANEFSMRIENDRKMAVENEKEIEQNQQERDRLQTQIAETLAKKADLQARLDKTPVKPAPPPKVVSIPSPRPAPEGAKRLSILCANNKIYPISIDDIRKDAEEKAKGIILRYKLNTNPEAGIDPEKFENFYTKLPSPNDEFFKVEYFVADKRWPRIRLIPRENKGITVEQLASTKSAGRRLLASIDPQKFYVVFDVLTNSFDAYLSARQVLMQANVPAGWEPRPDQWVYESWIPGNIELGPPRPPAPPPTTPQTPVKPPNVID